MASLQAASAVLRAFATVEARLGLVQIQKRDELERSQSIPFPAVD